MALKTAAVSGPGSPVCYLWGHIFIYLSIYCSHLFKLKIFIYKIWECDVEEEGTDAPRALITGVCVCEVRVTLTPSYVLH